MDSSLKSLGILKLLVNPRAFEASLILSAFFCRCFFDFFADLRVLYILKGKNKDTDRIREVLTI